MEQFSDNLVLSITHVDTQYSVMKIKFNTKISTDLISYDGENYKICTVYGSVCDDARFVLVKQISNHHNINKEPRKVILEDYYYMCPACKFRMEDFTDRCPYCDQKLIK